MDQQTALKLGQGLRELETNRKIEQVRNAVERAKRKETAKKYSDDIDKIKDGSFDKDKNSHLKLLDKTPQVYIDKANAKDLEITMKWDVAYLAMNKEGTIPGNYHGLGSDVMKALPRAIEDPLYVVKQDNGRFIAITEIIVKGNRQVIASIEFDGYTRTREEGKSGEGNYNLIVTAMDAKSRYLKNTVFRGEVVYNKNNEDPAHFIARLNSLKKALPSDDLAGSSANIVPQKTENVKGKVFYDERINLDDLTEKQRDEIAFAGTVIAAIGNTVHFYNSQYAPKDSREARTNGWYDPSDGSIHLDIAKIENGEESVLFTLSHELVHFIEDWSPAKYQTFANFLLKNYAEHGVATDQLVREKMAELNTTDYDYAMSELVADACERMLLDSNAAQKLAELNKTDKKLGAKIKEFFSNVLKRIRNAYANYKGRTEAQYLQKMDDVLSELHALFEDALVDAARNYQDADGKLGDSEVREQVKIQSKLRTDENVNLNKADLEQYLHTGKTLHTRNKKLKLIEFGKNPILTNSKETMQFISDAIHGKALGEVRAIKRVGERLANAVKEARNSLDIYGRYIELNADDLRESYKRHSSPKEKGDIALSEEDFQSIPQYIDTFDGVLSVNTHNGKTEIYLYKSINPNYVKILTVVSGERDSIIVSKLIGVSKKKFEEKYAKKMEKNIGSPRGQKDSNPSTKARHTADVLSNNIIPQSDGFVKYQKKQTSNRAILADLLEASIDTSTPEGIRQADLLDGYRASIGEIEKLEDRIRDASAEIKSIAFSTGKRDMERYNRLIEDRNRDQIRLNRLEREVLKLEALTPLKSLLDRQKAELRKRYERKGRELARNAVKLRVEKVERNQYAKRSKPRGLLLW